MKKILLLFIVLNSVLVSHAQKHLWQTFGENPTPGGQSTGQDVEIDEAGNLYVLNSSTGITIIGADTLYPPYPFQTDVWVGKFDKHGNKQWAITMGSSWFDFPEDMALDPFANVYVLVSFGSASQLVIADTTIPTAATAHGLVKLDSAGKFQWFTPTTYFPSCGKFITYSSGYIFMRSCNGIKRINTLTGAEDALSLNTSSLTLNSAGHKGMSTAPNGDILVTLSAEGLQAGNQIHPITPNAQGNGGNLHILRLDTALNIKAFKSYGSFLTNSGDYENPIAVDDSGFLYTIGVGNINQAFFGNDTLTPFNILLEIVLLKMDSMLNPVKLFPLYRSGAHLVKDMIFANNGFYVVGRTGYTEFPNGLILPNSVNGDNMVLKFSRTGQALWVNSSGNTNSAS
jgi:hypothetical protein